MPEHIARLIDLFLSTPSVRRATISHTERLSKATISIHALREEGDFAFCNPVLLPCFISIHALREEGDAVCKSLNTSADSISIHALREEGDLHNTSTKKP